MLIYGGCQLLILQFANNSKLYSKYLYICIMGNLTITNKVLDRYFDYLIRFDNKTKKKLIIKLTKSLEIKEKKSFDLKSLFGAWKDDRSTDLIIDEIKNSRVEPKDISL